MVDQHRFTFKEDSGSRGVVRQNLGSSPLFFLSHPSLFVKSTTIRPHFFKKTPPPIAFGLFFSLTDFFPFLYSYHQKAISYHSMILGR